MSYRELCEDFGISACVPDGIDFIIDEIMEANEEEA